MSQIRYSHNKPTLGFEEINAVRRTLESGQVSQGPQVEAFENELCEFFHLDYGHAAVVSSGSAALYLALKLFSSSKRDIGLPVYSCAALRNAIGLVNANPIYIDCGHSDPNLDLISGTQSTLFGIIAPSMYGLPLDLKFIKKPNFIIEDIAQSFGARVNGTPIGLRGDVGICSFYATKMFTSGGQGGAIISRDKAIIDEVKDYRLFDNRDDSKLRFNFQMTDTQAAIGRVQLSRLPEFISRRSNIFSIYKEGGLKLIDTACNSFESVKYRAIIITKYQTSLIKKLQNLGVNAIIPISKNELLDKPQNYPNALKLTQEAVSLPIYPTLKEKDAQLILSYINSCLEY
jgi:perosamine synthetase